MPEKLEPLLIVPHGGFEMEVMFGFITGKVWPGIAITMNRGLRHETATVVLDGDQARKLGEYLLKHADNCKTWATFEEAWAEFMKRCPDEVYENRKQNTP